MWPWVRWQPEAKVAPSAGNDTHGGRVFGGATSKRPTVGPSSCIRLEPQTSVHPRWDRVRLVASRVHDCGARSKLAERPHGTQTSRPADTQVSEARVGPDGFEFADLVHLVEPGKAEGRECPVQLDDPVE